MSVSSGARRSGGSRRRQLPRTGMHHGLHWAEWFAELLGTALLLLGGVSAICLDFGPHHPPLPHTLRLLLTGLLFAGSGSLVAVSPLGRRSGAHLNPAVSLGFYVQRHLTRGDLGAYVVSQCLGAILGAALVDLLWGRTARMLVFGLTQPGHGLAGWQAALLEAAMTACLVGAIFFCVSSPRTTRYTPLVTWLLVAGFVWGLAPFTGTSLNPARSLGPAVLVPSGHQYWVYVTGPLLGALLACAGWALVRSRSTLTAKLFHDPTYPSVMRSELPVAGHRPHPSPGRPGASPPGTSTAGS